MPSEPAEIADEARYHFWLTARRHGSAESAADAAGITWETAERYERRWKEEADETTQPRVSDG